MGGRSVCHRVRRVKGHRSRMGQTVQVVVDMQVILFSGSRSSVSIRASYSLGLGQL